MPEGANVAAELLPTDFKHAELIKDDGRSKQACLSGQTINTRLQIVQNEYCMTNEVTTDLHCVLEAVVELHLNSPVFCNRIQDHPQEQLPHALENSMRRQTQWDTHTCLWYQLLQLQYYSCIVYIHIQVIYWALTVFTWYYQIHESFFEEEKIEYGWLC